MKKKLVNYYSALLATVMPNHFRGTPAADDKLIAMSESSKATFGLDQGRLDALRAEREDLSIDLDQAEELARAVFADLHDAPDAQPLIEAAQNGSGTGDDAFLKTISSKLGVNGVTIVTLAVSDTARLAQLLEMDISSLEEGWNVHG